MSGFMSKTFAKYLRLGLTPRPVRGNWRGGEDMYSLWHGSIQYCIDDWGDYENDSNPTYLLECINMRSVIIERNNKIVAEVFSYLQERLSTDIWVRVNGGSQLNCTFGDSTGPLAHLLMDFIDRESFDSAIERVKGFITDIDCSHIEYQEKFMLMITSVDSSEIFKYYTNPDIDVVLLQ